MKRKRSMGRRESKTGAEADLGWREVYCYLQKAGTTSSIKRGTRRRERHNAKQDIRKEL